MGLIEYLGLTGGPDPAADNARLRRRVALLEAQVAALASRSGVDLTRIKEPCPVSDRVRALVREGRDIQAIKAHREETGLGLRAAKDDVDDVKRGRW